MRSFQQLTDYTKIMVAVAIDAITRQEVVTMIIDLRDHAGIVLLVRKHHGITMKGAIV